MLYYFKSYANISKGFAALNLKISTEPTTLTGRPLHIKSARKAKALWPTDFFRSGMVRRPVSIDRRGRVDV